MTALVVAAVVVLAAVGIALYLLLGRDDTLVAANEDGTTATSEEQSSSAEGTTSSAERTTASETTPPEETSGSGALPNPTVTPDGLGNDPVLDVLAIGCFAGVMQSCDDLYDAADSGSDYETYGDSCAGRQPTGTSDYCTDTFPQN
jgi:hypothetical protein